MPGNFLYELIAKTSAVSTGLSGQAHPSFSSDGKKILAYEVYETADYGFGGIVSIDLEFRH